MTTSSLSERLKMLRESRKLTHTEFASNIDVDENMVLLWENEESKPTKSELAKVAKIFNVPADWLLDAFEVKTVNLQEPEISTIGERIKLARKDNKMSYVKVAAQIGVDRRTVSAWERDEFIPGKSRLLKIAKLFNVSVDWLKNGDDLETEFSNKTEENILTAETLTTGFTSEETYYLITLFESLSPVQRGRLLGYLDGLHREQMLGGKTLAG